MATDGKTYTWQLAAAGFLLAIAIARLVWEDFAGKTDAIFLGLVAASLVLVLVPLNAIRSLKAGGLELSLDAPHVQGAVASLSLPRIENAKLQKSLESLSHILPAVNGSRVLWIDDRPEKILGERRLLRALGVTVVSATSSDEARQIIGRDNDFDVIVTDVQRRGETYKMTGGVDIHEGTNFAVWLRTKYEDPYVRKIPIIFYAAYPWPSLVEFTRPARELHPEAEISNSITEFIPKLLRTIAHARETAIDIPSEKTPTGLRKET